MNEGLYILLIVIVFAILYVDHMFQFLSGDWQSNLFHIELGLMLIGVLLKIREKK